MEMCPNCGEVFPSSVEEHHIQDCIENMKGALTYLPSHYKHWKNTLEEYREEWIFLPLSLRHRVAEQLMSFDYLWTLQDWLNPKLTIARTQKVQATMVIASVYEGILSEIILMVINQKRANDKLFEKLMYKPKGHWGFERLISIAKTIEFIDNDWEEYISNIRKIRNWVHLSNQQKSELRFWLDRTDYGELKSKLYEFKSLAQPCFD